MRPTGDGKAVQTRPESAMAKTKQRPLDVDTLYGFERLGPPTLSPDGRQAICTLSTPSL